MNTPNPASFPEFARGPKTPKKSRRVSTALWLILFLGGGILFWGTLYWLYRNSSPPAKATGDPQASTHSTSAKPSPVLTNSIPAINLSTLPRTLPELNRWYAEPVAGDNMAPAILDVCERVRINARDKSLYTLPVLGSGKLPVDGLPLDVAVKPTMKSLIQQNAAALDKMQPATGFTQSRYPINLSQGALMVMPHLPKIEIAAKLAGMASLFYADTQQPERAGQMVLFCLALAHSLEYEPALFSQYTRIRCDVIALNCLSQVLNRTALSKEGLDRLQQAMNQAEELGSQGIGFTRGLAGERARGLAMFDLTPEVLVKETAVSANSSSAKNPSELLDHIRKHAQEDHAFLEDFFAKFFAARSQFPPGSPQMIDTLNQLETQWEQKRRKLYVSNLAISMVMAAVKVEPMLLAHLRLARVALALERYRLKYQNQYPDALPSLTPEFLAQIPADPFTGTDLGYSKIGQGFKVECSKPSDGMAQGELDYSFSVTVPSASGG